MTPPVPSAPAATPAGLADALRRALTDGDGELRRLPGRQPANRADRFRTLLTVYDLHTAPLPALGPVARFQHHPVIAELKGRLEAAWLAELARPSVPADLAENPVEALRVIAARDRLPTAYRWLAKEAGWEEVIRFLALEGGPDAGFDDLVAVCQIGLHGAAKLELARNYWDEMGNGTPGDVHTALHDRLVAAIGMPRIPRAEQPTSALQRAALGGLLATNRWLQPEMLGALGLLELQAGPRCRLVLQAFDRLGAPEGAYPFYAVHAEVDPRHGRDWLDKAIAPVVAERPEWAAGIVRGAWWRSRVNAAFFTELLGSLRADTRAA